MSTNTESKPIAEEYNPVAKRLTIEEIKHVTGERTIPLTGVQNDAKVFTTETGEDFSRVALVAALLNIEDISKSTAPFYNGKLADPTGAIIINAGQYQPEASAIMGQLRDEIDTTGMPILVTVIGKPAVYKPADGTPLMNLRVETIRPANPATQQLFLEELKTRLGERLEKNQLSPEIVAKYTEVMQKL